MPLVTRPRRVGFGDFDFGDLTLDPSTIDFSSAASSTPDFSKLASGIVKGASDFYGAQAAINDAKYKAQLAKAQAQTAVAVAKAGGANAALTAKAGLPSPTLLLIGGLGLAAILILKR